MSYETEWKTIRKALAHHWLLFFGSIVLPLVGFFLIAFPFGWIPGQIAFVSLAVLVIIQQSRLCRARCFPCPRCGQPFRKSGLYGFGSTCQHCSIRFGDTTATPEVPNKKMHDIFAEREKS